MLEILLVVHLVIAMLLVTVILVQKSNAEGVSGIGGSNLGVISGKSTNSFLLRTTIILATAFITNSLILSNLSSRRSNIIHKKIESIEEKQQEHNTLPIAK